MKAKPRFVLVPAVAITTAAPVFVMLNMMKIDGALLIACSIGAATFVGALFTYTSESILSSVPSGRIGAWLDRAFANLLLQQYQEKKQ
jgi:hypothetical protein